MALHESYVRYDADPIGFVEPLVSVGVASDEDLRPVLCHRCGRGMDRDAVRCLECSERMARSVFPARCLSWGRFEILVALAVLLVVATAALASWRPAFLSACAATALGGLAVLYAREAYGPFTYRRAHDEVRAHLRRVPFLRWALRAALVSALARLLSPWVGALEPLAWSLLPLCAVLCYLHWVEGRPRRDRALRELLRAGEEGWEVLEPPGSRSATLTEIEIALRTGGLRKDASVRGPGTQGRWTTLDRVPDLARALGCCHACGEAQPVRAPFCSGCGAPFFDTAPVGLGLPSLVLRLSVLRRLRVLGPILAVCALAWLGLATDWESVADPQRWERVGVAGKQVLAGLWPLQDAWTDRVVGAAHDPVVLWIVVAGSLSLCLFLRGVRRRGD